MDPRKIFGETFGTEWIIAACVFGLIVLTVLYAMVRSHFRKRSGKPASQRSKNTPLELTYAAVVAGIVGFVVFTSFRATAEEAKRSPHPAATVNIKGFQWCWQFSYPGHDRSETGSCIGRANRPTMVVPAGVPVKLNITGADVIHSWFVPELRYKLDAFPNHVNSTTIVFKHPGTFLGHCAEFCGPNHYSMLFYVKVVPLKQYQQWLAGNAPVGAVA